MSELLECKQGQMSRAQRLAVPFLQLTATLFRESNPAPLKYALSLLGLMSPKVRLPLVELTNPTKAELTGILAQVCDGYSVSMIGKIRGSAHGNVQHA
jgi:4-hydroxy-tetrahydrodipicolinate synthase